MVFSSNIFLLYFMPAFFLVYFLMPRKTRNYVLLLASLIFYAWGAPEFIIQLIVSLIANFFIVRWMCKTEKTSAKKWLCALSIIISLGLLFFYKYGNFTMQNLNALLGLTGHAPLSWKRIMLPIGISFFSFQSVTYTLDTYRGVNQPMKKLSDYMLYITMFPQLIAGPIVRYTDVADQIRQRESTMADRLQGFYRFVIGLCKKILIADVLGLRVDQMLGAANIDAAGLSEVVSRIASLDTGSAWLVALAYTFQIYFDFAGYSDMAIGLGRIMGFTFPENFDNPYTSRSITEFWRRWHKTLGAFIMNYLYIPLGGNRKGTFGSFCIIIVIAAIAVFLSGSWWVGAALGLLAVILVLVAIFKPEKRRNITTEINRMDTMLLGGLWHGASWNFMIWGGLNGLGMVFYRFWKDWSVMGRALFLALVTFGLHLLCVYAPQPVFNVLFVWCAVALAGNLVRVAYHLCGGKKPWQWLNDAWAVFQTFTFITFTRLFFRSGSNLDPAVANETAWNTAKNMVNQMGSHWDLSKIPDIVMHYGNVFILIVIGMVIHWLPENFKRRYRIWFAKMPLPLMVLFCVIVVFVIYQFITADLQAFIYFQF